MTPQERIAAKETEHEARQTEADRNDLQPDALRRATSKTTTKAPAPTEAKE